MTTQNHEINLALRTAAGHERAARAAEEAGTKQYEMKMISAGASAYAAFVLAIKSAPEYQGRKIDDAAIRRIYSSTRPRPWWDAHLKSVKIEGKPADREWGKRLIQWHLDPEAAKARRAQGNARRLANHARAKQRAETQGRRPPQAAVAPSTADMRSVHAAAQTTALAGRELSPEESGQNPLLHHLHLQVDRMRAAIRRVAPEDRAAVLEILRVTAGEVEKYAP